ncbi:hypothetical protein KJ751_01860 [Patescibacteria group bacterium]|nr:hypothetical protein [Patescibacteria group bacterium]
MKGEKMGEEMTNGEFFEILEAWAGEYYTEAIDLVFGNNLPMNDLNKVDADGMFKKNFLDSCQRFTEAVIVDFINFICASWGGDRGLYTHCLSKERYKNKKRNIYKGKPKGIHGSDFLAILASMAGDYHRECLESIVRSKHMNDLNESDIGLLKRKQVFFQKFADAILVDFINFIGAEQFGIDYAIYTRHLSEEYKKNREKEKK